MTTFVEPDDCCGKPLARALRKEELNDDAETWTCPKCGTEWKPFVDGEMKVWRPQVVIAVFKV